MITANTAYDNKTATATPRMASRSFNISYTATALQCMARLIKTRLQVAMRQGFVIPWRRLTTYKLSLALHVLLLHLFFRCCWYCSCWCCCCRYYFDIYDVSNFRKSGSHIKTHFPKLVGPSGHYPGNGGVLKPHSSKCSNTPPMLRSVCHDKSLSRLVASCAHIHCFRAFK